MPTIFYFMLFMHKKFPELHCSLGQGIFFFQFSLGLCRLFSVHFKEDMYSCHVEVAVLPL